MSGQKLPEMMGYYIHDLRDTVCKVLVCCATADASVAVDAAGPVSVAATACAGERCYKNRIIIRRSL